MTVYFVITYGVTDSFVLVVMLRFNVPRVSVIIYSQTYDDNWKLILSDNSICEQHNHV